MPNLHSRLTFLTALTACFLSQWLGAASLYGQFSMGIDIEKAPFEYTQAVDNNRVSRLRDRLQAGELQLAHSLERGNLEALLQVLELPQSSQVLVFSKTSMQVRYISGRNPRAIYFNDDTYLGWVYGSSLVEISTADPLLGTAFYTIDMGPTRPKLKRADYDCMACHATTLTQGVPGHTVRSVFPTIDGSVDPQRPSFITNDSSPLEQRWGGWYVTGKHGSTAHMGNAYLRGAGLDTRDNGNRTVLQDEFSTSRYLTPYSDIVALLVLEHQTQMHNTLTRADFFVRQLLHDAGSDSSQNPTEQTLTDDSQQEWRAQLRLIAREVVQRLLFCQEAQLTHPIEGSNTFAEEFVQLGPRDSQQRTLREFDLQTRMFRYPCSYMIYSSSFDSLQPVLRQEIYGQLQTILTADSAASAAQSKSQIDYQHLSAESRADIREILSETKSDLPDNW